MAGPKFNRYGQCRECKRSGMVATAQRFAGGSYKRGGRWYSSSICEECAVRLATHADNARKVLGWSATQIKRLVAPE